MDICNRKSLTITEEQIKAFRESSLNSKPIHYQIICVNAITEKNHKIIHKLKGFIIKVCHILTIGIILALVII